MPFGRILVEKFQPEVIEWLRARAEVVVVDPGAEPEHWEHEAPRVDAVISRKGRITRRHIEESRGRLKIVARTGVGVDSSRIDLDAAREHQVWVTNMPGVNAAAVAELAFGHMIALARYILLADSAMKANRWSDSPRFQGTELAGKTIGIIGMGNIGTRVALRARAFEMQLLVCDPYIPASHVTALGGRPRGALPRIRLRHPTLPAQQGNAPHGGRQAARAHEEVCVSPEPRARRHPR